jgi:hypothetical protein
MGLGRYPPGELKILDVLKTDRLVGWHVDSVSGSSEEPQSTPGAELGASPYVRDDPLLLSVLGLSASWTNLQRKPNEHPPGLS